MRRIGILGVAHLHVDSYIVELRAAGVTVVGVFDNDEERAAAWGARFKTRAYPSVDSLLAEGLDGVLVCSETLFHLEFVSAAASAGVAVFCEKPLGVSAKDSRAIVDVCREYDVTMMVALPTRMSPVVDRVRRMVAEGDLGVIRSFSGMNQSVMPMKERSWFVDKRLAGGGAIMDHVVHLADAATWILDEEPESVYAVSNRIMHADVVAVETSGLVLVQYSSGAFASIDCSWNRPLNYPKWGGLSFSIVGDGGTADVDSGRQELTHFGGDQKYSWVPFGINVNRLLIVEFLDAIEEKRLPCVTGENGLSASRVALAAMQSLATGQPVMMADV
jgi:predicted dehydrogenase